VIRLLSLKRLFNLQGSKNSKQVKYFYNLVFILLLFSCGQKADKESEIIVRFEKVLGHPEVSYLDEIVADFDDYLKNTYPGERDKFKAFLSDISASKSIPTWQLDSLKTKRYKGSKLFDTYKLVYPDSVWFNGTTFSVDYSEYGNTEVIPIINGGSDSINVDSTILALERTPYQMLIEKGRFYVALDSIAHLDSLVSSFLDAWEASHSMSPSNLANGLAYSLTDDNAYFAKRIFIMTSRLASQGHTTTRSSLRKPGVARDKVVFMQSADIE